MRGLEAALSQAAAIALLLTACAPWVRAPEVHLRSVDAGSADTILVELEIVNPNCASFRLVSADYCISVANGVCGRGRRSGALPLPAHDTALADFPLLIDYSALLKSIPTLFSDSVKFGVTGNCVVSSIVGRRRFGFSGERKVAVRDMLELFIDELPED